MITIIPALEILKAVTDKNISGNGADARRESFDLAVDLKSLGDVKILIEGILYNRVKHRIEDIHKIFFEKVCDIDNSAKDVTDYDIQKAIKWIANSESKSRRVIIITENISSYVSSEKIKVITPMDFIYHAKKIVELTKNKTFISVDEFLLALFFL